MPVYMLGTNGPGLHGRLCVSGWEGMRSGEHVAAASLRLHGLSPTFRWDPLLPPFPSALPKHLQTSSTTGRCSQKTNTGKLQHMEGLVTYPLFSSRITFLERNFAWSGAFLLVKSEVTWKNI